MATQEKLTVILEEERETKNMIRFQEIPDPQTPDKLAIGTLYVSKDTIRLLDIKGPGRKLQIVLSAVGK